MIPFTIFGEGLPSCIAGPHAFSTKPCAGCLSGAEAACEEEVERAEDGCVGANDADVDFWPAVRKRMISVLVPQGS